MTDQWACPAYGADGAAVGAICFFADLHERSCTSEAVCHGRLAVERRRVFRRITEMAAAGDPVGEYLAAEFTSPDHLLGGAG